jgi:hypothetical protein
MGAIALIGALIGLGTYVAFFGQGDLLVMVPIAVVLAMCAALKVRNVGIVIAGGFAILLALGLFMGITLPFLSFFRMGLLLIGGIIIILTSFGS